MPSKNYGLAGGELNGKPVIGGVTCDTAGCRMSRNLISLQQVVALKAIGAQVKQDLADGYGIDADAGLDRYAVLRDLIDKGTVA